MKHILRDDLIDVLRKELRRQAEVYGMDFTQWYNEDDTPAPGVNYEGNIHLAEMADAITRATEIDSGDPARG